VPKYRYRLGFIVTGGPISASAAVVAYQGVLATLYGTRDLLARGDRKIFYSYYILVWQCFKEAFMAPRIAIETDVSTENVGLRTKG
jgi:hypothetical protein